MSAQSPRWLAVITVFVLAPLAPAPACAAEPAAGVPAGLRAGVHIVRPGDTLEQLAALYLGSARRWPEIARLNPDVHDPKKLRPGSRLSILLAEGSAPPAAQIESLSHQVDERPSPIPWSQARKDDVLIEQDGVRTHRQSSAAMRFTDGTRLVVTEDSLVFLRRTAERGKASSGPGKSIEIVEGQADVATAAGAHPTGRSPRPPRPPDIEIVLGNAKATSRPKGDGAAQARARRPGEGGAKLMVYGGEGEVEAAGAKVAVGAGMGTSVGKEGPPLPPERLLPAPRLVSPPPDADFAFANPVFSWEPVPEAAAYVVELCGDAGCGALLDRAVLGNQPEWHPESLTPGTLYWRVTARSRSGLDGYPAAPTRLVIGSDRVDREAPAARLELSGTTIDVAGRLFTTANVGVKITAEDGGCGLLRAEPAVDGRLSPAGGAGAKGPLPAGEHRAGGAAVDRCGNRLEVPPLAFTVDTEPPNVACEVTDRAALERGGEPRAARGTSRRYAEPSGTGLYWSSDGRRWLPLWRPGKAGGKTPAFGGDEIASEHPQLFLRALGVKLTIDGREVAPAAGQLLWLRAEDAGVGVERLRFHAVDRGAEQAPVLELEAVDLLGNARRLSWPLGLR
jgi:LysM domain-containing protein